MRLIIFTFLSIYGLFHLYAFMKARAAFRFGSGPGTALGLFMAFMVFGPIMVRQSERLGLEVFAVSMSYAGYAWMGLLFMFVSWSLFIDIYRVSVWSFGRVSSLEIAGIMPSAGLSFILPVLLALATGIYGYFEADNIRAEHLVIKSTKITKDNNRFRIVQISDVHLGLIIGEEKLKKIIEEVRSAAPDIIVSTGDLVDGQLDGLNELAQLLKGIDAPYGKFAVSGNHEYYAGFEQSAEFIKEAGFTMLRGEAVSIPGIINIAGVDDSDGKRFGHFKGLPEKEILSALDRERFTLLLKHKPLIDDDSLGMFDLQLSGHTHMGQIFPFKFIVQLFFPRIAGYFDLGYGSRLYVSRGAGTWGPPIRFLSPPEVTVIDLVRDGEA
jgi:hypothetical protein